MGKVKIPFKPFSLFNVEGEMFSLLSDETMATLTVIYNNDKKLKIFFNASLRNEIINNYKQKRKVRIIGNIQEEGLFADMAMYEQLEDQDA